MSDVEFLGIEDLLSLTGHLGAGPVRDLGLLDSAVSRPRASLFGEEAYPTLALKAAALLESICRNHALVDGNKRLAWLATTTFLHMNGHPVEMSDDDAFALVIEVATGGLDLTAVADRLSAAMTP
ncbi:MAG: type II toxin-antitoxin system death-on-curing family toxin [Thermoleophilia bacterium]